MSSLKSKDKWGVFYFLLLTPIREGFEYQKTINCFSFLKYGFTVTAYYMDLIYFIIKIWLYCHGILNRFDIFHCFLFKDTYTRRKVQNPAPSLSLFSFPILLSFFLSNTDFLFIASIFKPLN